MNHSNRPKTVTAELRLPAGWKTETQVGKQTIAPLTEGRIRLSAVAPASPDRAGHVLGLVATVDGRPFGEFAEAIVNFLGG